MSSQKILSCGEVLWDLFPDGPRFGGAPANFACHAAMLGGQVSLLSAVGNDLRGDQAIGILHKFGLNTSFVQRIRGDATGSVGVGLDDAGKPGFEIHAPSAWDRVEWSRELQACLADADAIYFGTLGQRGEVSRATIRRAVGLAKERRILRVLDVNLRPPFHDAVLIRDSLALASVLKLSDDELGEVAAACGVSMTPQTEQVLLNLREQFGLQCVVMTRGAKGAVMVSEKGAADHPGIPVQVVDTVGAGDSFMAAFVLGLLRGDEPQDILRKACGTAALTCSHAGAVPAAEEQLAKTTVSTD
jgi:fructokinase